VRNAPFFDVTLMNAIDSLCFLFILIKNKKGAYFSVAPFLLHDR